MAEDLPPVTFGIKVTDENPGHVRLTLFAGRNPDARGACGSCTMRPDEYAEFVRRLQPEVIHGPSWPVELLTPNEDPDG